MLAERPNLINGGIQYFNLDKNKEALKFFATYVESASYPMLADKELAKMIHFFLKLHIMQH